MGFYYSGNIEKLKTFYLSMRKINVQIGTFEYTYNGTYYREQTAQNQMLFLTQEILNFGNWFL